MLNNSFLKPVIILVAIAVPVWLIARIAFRKRIPGVNISFMREFLYFLFFLYLIALAAITIVPLSFAMHKTPSESDINLIPFKTIWNAIRSAISGHHRFRPSMLFENTTGNIVLFLPLGFLLPMVARKTNSFAAIFFIALLCSAVIECVQYIERSFGAYRSVDVDDLILNTLGAILGWLFLCLIRKIGGVKPQQ
ncbi:MAG: VanZ family protein [Sediminibacterium sp.]